MKIILEKDVKGLGKRGEIVEASDGYARNYLIPRNMAVQANDGNLHQAKQQLKAKERREAKNLESAQNLKERIENLSVSIQMKAGENGRLFGSVTNKEIADELKKQHRIPLDKRKINMTDPIKNLGETPVEIRLYPGVAATLNVSVTAE